MTKKELKDMLMDVGVMDFANVDSVSEQNNVDEQNEIKANSTQDFENVDDISGSSTSDEDLLDEESFLKDPSTGEVMMKLTSNKYLPLTKGNPGNLHFKMGTIASANMAFISEKDNTNLYPVSLPKVDTSNEYSDYVKRLFDIYSSLGDDKVYSIPTIGIINTSFEKEHTTAVNLAMETLITELEAFIDLIKNNPKMTSKYLELEDSLTILNCLQLIHFTLDSPDISDIRSKFINGLLNWINRSDGEPNAAYIEQIFNMTNDTDKNIFDVSLFWNLLNQLLLRGLFEQALGCIERSGVIPYLENTCEVSSNAMKDLVQLIQQYPMDSTQTFREWKALALELGQTYIDSETNVSGELRDSIEDTLLLIGGHQNKIISASRTWYESFCAMFLFYIPSLELASEFLQLSLNANPLDITNPWEQSCTQLITGDIYHILPVLESLDTCTASFGAAIVEAKGLLESYYDNDTNTPIINSPAKEDIFAPTNGMASYMLMNFAFDLCASDNKDFWAIAIGLISIVPNVKSGCKRTTISELLLHYPFKTNDDIEWMFSVCAKWRLPEVSRSLYTMLGSSMMNEGRTIEAMTNYSKAGKFNFVKEYSWTLFEAALMKGEPLDDIMLNAIVNDGYTDSDGLVISEEILQNVVTDAMRQTLAPYAVLFRFFQAKDNENWAVTLDLLMSLIDFQYLPNYYLVILIAKFLYPIFLINDSKLIKDEYVLTVMKQMKEKWDSEDYLTKSIYITLLEESDEQLSNLLPKTLKDLKKRVNKKLSFKLCQEFM